MTHIDLWVRNKDNDYGRNEQIQNIWKEVCKENMWTC